MSALAWSESTRGYSNGLPISVNQKMSLLFGFAEAFRDTAKALRLKPPNVLRRYKNNPFQSVLDLAQRFRNVTRHPIRHLPQGRRAGVPWGLGPSPCSPTPDPQRSGGTAFRSIANLPLETSLRSARACLGRVYPTKADQRDSQAQGFRVLLGLPWNKKDIRVTGSRAK